MILGRLAVPRWWLPVTILLMGFLAGCSGRNDQAGDEGGMKVPAVRMALLKIPLDSSETNLLEDSDPIERFAPEPVAVAYTPPW